jgi:hypothetical protein
VGFVGCVTVRGGRVAGGRRGMDELGLFTAALGLSGPWRVTRSEFDAGTAQLDLYLGFDRGARFACPAKDCAQGSCPVHDTVERTWRHLDFFPHKVGG